MVVRWDVLVAVGSALALAAMFIRAAWHHGPGLPLDDPYIYFVYARNAAHGAWFQYNPGDPATSGATSLLWLLLLTAASALGAHGSALVFWDFGLEAACAAVTVLCVRGAMRGLGLDSATSTVLAVACLVTGSVAVALWNGLETACAVAAVAAFVCLEARGRRAAAAVLAVAMPLIRPDIAVAFAVTLPWLWGMWPLRGRSRLGWLPGISVVCYAALMGVVTGRPEMGGGAAKILWLVPHVPLARMLAYAATGIADSLGSVARSPGLPGSVRLFGTIATAVLWWLAVRGWREGADPRAWLGRECGALALVGAVVEGLAFGPPASGSQFGRYLSPLVPLLLIAAACGVAVGGSGRPRMSSNLSGSQPTLRRRGASIMAGACLLAGLSLLPYSLGVMREASREIAAEQLHMARWIARTLPADAVVVVNDAGAMAYYGGRYTVDGMGITTDGLAAAARTPGQAGEWPAVRAYLARRGLAGRPTYAVVYPDWLPSLVARGTIIHVFRLIGPHIIDGPTVDVVRLPSGPAGPSPTPGP